MKSSKAPVISNKEVYILKDPLNSAIWVFHMQNTSKRFEVAWRLSREQLVASADE